MTLRLVPTGLLVLLMAALTWCAWPTTDAAPIDGEASKRAPSTQPAEPARATAGNSERQPREQPPPITPSDDRVAAPGATLRLALVGLHPEQAWTSDLHVELKDRKRPYTHGEVRFDVQVEDGRASFAMPDWWHAGYPTKLTIQGRNVGYRDLSFRHKGVLSIDTEVPIQVTAITELRGTVRDVHGNPIEHCRVSALRQPRPGTTDSNFGGETGTDAEGRFRLLAPPDVPLEIVVCAMKPNLMRWRRLDGVTDSGEVRGDLLPASRQVTLSMHRPRTGCDFVLPAAAIVTGTVKWPNGEPVHYARIRYVVGNGDEIALGHSTQLVRQPDGTVLLNGFVFTDSDGNFRVPLPHGATAALWLAGLQKVQIVGELARQELRGPTELHLVPPQPITLKITDGGKPVSRAHVSFERGFQLRGERNGELRLILTRPERVRVQSHGKSSRWLSLGPEQAGQSLELQYPR